MLPPPLLFRPATKSFQNFKSKVLDNVKSEINRVTMYTMKCSYIKRQDGRVVSRRIIETNRHGIFTRDMEAIHIFHIPRLFRPVEV